MTRPTQTSADASVHPKDNRRWFRRHPGLALSLLVLIGILFVDFAIGSVLHAAGVVLPAMSPNIAHSVQHPVYHHGLRPNVANEAVWGSARYKMYVNSLGMKDARVRDVPLRSGSRRILLMGDSFTEGNGLAYEDTFAGMVAARLAGSEVEFLNAGVSSYSPTIYLRKTQHLIDTVGLQVNHVSVAIDISDIFDETRYSVDANGNVQCDRDTSLSEAVKEFLARHTVLIGALRVWIRAIKDAGRTEEELRGLNRDKSRWVNDENHWKSHGKQGMTLAIQHMNQLHDYLLSKGIGLNIMIYPWPDQIMLRDLNSRQVRAWSTWAKQRKVDLVNLFPDFIGSLPPKETLKRYFIPGDIHWNKAGHALVATRLVEYFRKQEGR